MLQLDDMKHVALWSPVRGLSAGSGSDDRYVAAERKFGFRIRRMYGLTECAGHALMPADAPEDVRMLRDGLPFDGVECYIAGDAEVGEYFVRGPSLMLGYLNRPELTAEMVSADGFLRTGDVMSIDESGFVRYVGRLKDVIRRGGINIDPLEPRAPARPPSGRHGRHRGGNAAPAARRAGRRGRRAVRGRRADPRGPDGSARGA